jgi:protein-S-isoprenylcysteine O-methyltransferase Ste14
MEMYRAVQIALVIAWVLWAWPFLAYKARTPTRPAEVTVTSSGWGIGLQMVAYFLAWSPSSTAKPWPLLLTGLLLTIPAVILSSTGIRNLGKQLRVQAGLYSDHELIRTGPYQIVRHPIYAGMLLMYLATALIRSTWPVMLAGLVIFIAGTEIRVRIEDRLLASRFGKQFDAYKATVPAYIPGGRWIHLSVSMK